jgi:hypothetical protein
MVYTQPTSLRPNFAIRGCYIYSFRIPQSRGTIELSEDVVVYEVSRWFQIL